MTILSIKKLFKFFGVPSLCSIMTLGTLSLTYSVHAQSFNQVYVGSNLYCGSFPNGKKELLINDNGNYRLISVSQATKPLTRELSKARADLRQLNSLINKVKSQGVSPSEISAGEAFYAEVQMLLYGGIVDPTGLPDTASEQLVKLQALKSDISSRINQDTKKIAAIENYKKHCKKSNPDFSSKTISIRMSDYRVLTGELYYIFNPGVKSLSQCLQIGKKPGATTLGVYSLTKNPCASGGFNCSNQLHSGEIGYFQVVYDDTTSPSQSTINREVEQVTDTYEKGLYSCGK